MLRRVLIGALLAGIAVAFAAPALAVTQVLMPNVSYSRQVQFTAHGPVVLHVITAPRPGGLYALKPILSNGAITGTERVTSMQKDISGTATVAGVNGDLFNFNDGHPSGMLMQGRRPPEPAVPLPLQRRHLPPTAPSPSAGSRSSATGRGSGSAGR